MARSGWRARNSAGGSAAAAGGLAFRVRVPNGTHLVTPHAGKDVVQLYVDGAEGKEPCTQPPGLALYDAAPLTFTSHMQLGKSRVLDPAPYTMCMSLGTLLLAPRLALVRIRPHLRRSVPYNTLDRCTLGI